MSIEKDDFIIVLETLFVTVQFIFYNIFLL
jgi:hypothetical protein